MIPAILSPDAFEAALKAQLESEIKTLPARAWHPSQLGHSCDRFLVWQWTKWDQGKRTDYVLQSVFDEGRLHQPSIYDRLEKMGFEVSREHYKPLEHKLAAGGVISGTPDGAFLGYKGERFEHYGIAEMKTCQEHAYHRLDTIRDFQEAREPWLRGYLTQSNLYCFLDEQPWFAIVLKSKGTGMVKPICGELDYEAAEQTLQRVERLQPMVDKKVDPAPIMYDDSICGRCKFQMICYPPRQYGDGCDIIEDSGLADDIEQRETRRQAKREYDALDKAIKKRLKSLGVKQGICGQYLITSTDVPVREYTVDARVDRRYDFQPLTVDDIEKIERGEAG